MKFRILFLLLMPLSALAGTPGFSNPFRGYTKINRLIHERIAQSNGLELGQYLGENAAIPASGDLLGLLGTYVGSDTSAEFRNGDPNSINMLLWYIALDKLATAIAYQCVPGSAPRVKGEVPLSPQPALLAALKPICAWPAASAKDDTVLFNFWNTLLAFDAPPEEFDAWKAFFLNDPGFANATPMEAITAMALAALYNPYFLLEE